MKRNPDQPPDGAELRRLAEERLKSRRTEDSGQKTESEPARLVHELQVHQIELEMQNEELQQARARMEALLAQYTDLYDFAPTGYFNLAPDGTILAVNLTGTRLLGLGRAELLKRHLGLLVAEADRRALNDCLDRTFAATDRQCCEVALLSAEKEPLFIHVEMVVAEGRRECRAAVLDVTDRHRAEAERERLIQELQVALAQAKLLSGLLPICAYCKKIRDDQGYWKQIESYIAGHSEAKFSHGICPECVHKLYPEQEQRVLEGMKQKERQNAGPTA
ncbi:MAG: PAS domain-containing protein [Verrucomicrobia bacterium]|nr:PAS domain-containing protein [Verrucomicrobiota bacterium]